MNEQEPVKKPAKRVRRAKEHYVNNKEFSQAVVDYVNSVNESRAQENEEPVITDYIGRCFLKICDGLSHKPNFIGYTYREEMVMDAVENCIKAIMNYDVKKATRTGLPNAFAYFTQISYYAFLRRIAKEKKQQDIKERYMAYAGVEAFADFNATMPNADSQNIVDQIRNKNQSIKDKDEALKKFDKHTKQEKKEKLARGIELFF
tara:strand:+ start:2800 stop:3411 length:612 start_codon:yes stop_codon:yes gene_type:complete